MRGFLPAAVLTTGAVLDASAFVLPASAHSKSVARQWTAAAAPRARGAALLAGGGFESGDASVTRKAKQSAAAKKAKAKAAVKEGGAAAPAAPKAMETASEGGDTPRPGRIVEPVAEPGSRQDEILAQMGVQGVRRDKRGAYIPPGQQEAEKKEIMVTMFDVIPVELQGGIEKFLITGIACCLTFFLASGIALGLEAYAVTTKVPLPDNVDQFIVSTLEPAFTPSLLVTLGFSSVLGIFKLGQLGRAGVNYRE
ncbi:hypothetical protein JKP88DRAFT_267776 [Tribonema minus]|uniref:Uncharacterized protein n=1 Tax=Tribonema minus TaxID=303371 RepID=A0A835Z5R9_9STRA|nr:hypothetical protein JKP88DRAFT_267776 [Tribonema minus]